MCTSVSVGPVLFSATGRCGSLIHQHIWTEGGEGGEWVVGWLGGRVSSSVRSVYTYTSIGISSSSKWAVCVCVCRVATVADTEKRRRRKWWRRERKTTPEGGEELCWIFKKQKTEGKMFRKCFSG